MIDLVLGALKLLLIRGTIEQGDGLSVFTPPHEVVPLRDQVAEWAALMAKRYAPVHAAASLPPQLRRVLLLVDLFEVHQPQRNGPSLR